MNQHRASHLAARLVVLLFIGVSSAHASISVDIGTGAAASGQTTSFAVTLQTGGAEVVGVGNHIGFAPPLQIVARPDGKPDCLVNPNISKEATAFAFSPSGCTPGISCTGIKSDVLSFQNLDPIPSGVLYTCSVAISDPAASGVYPLLNISRSASDKLGRFLAAEGADGSITVHGVSVVITVGDAEISSGGNDTVGVRLSTGGSAVVGIRHQIDFSPPLHIAARDDGDPDCAVNPAINRESTSFRFLPPGCAAEACTGVRAVVLSFTNLAPIADGATLYTCRIAVDAGAAPGMYPLRNSDPSASTPAGVAVSTTGRDGTITVDDALVGIDIGTVRAAARQRITIEVRFDVFDAGAPPVVGTQNEIFFDPMTPITAGGDGQPDCQVEPSINKNGTSFIFLPPDCTPDLDCDGVRAFVLATDNTFPIPTGSVLYRCAAQVADDAPLGSYALINANAASSDAHGQPVETHASNGSVEVICPGDCDGNGKVAIFELVRGLNVLLGNDPLSVCPVFDLNDSATVTIDEVVVSVSSALRGCNVPE